MASAKIATLLIRTIAKPISNQIKMQAKEHPTFRSYCVALAQRMHRGEVKLRTNLLGEQAKSIRPLSEARAIENGANAIAEGFLFSVAAALIIGESWRSSRSQAKRRDNVDDRIELLASRVDELEQSVKSIETKFDERWAQEKERNDELTQILNRVVDVGIRGGWSLLDDTPLRVVDVKVPPEAVAVDSTTAENLSTPLPEQSISSNNS